jgi:F0F1-type ATP synthase membrane subunit b/b'
MDNILANRRKVIDEDLVGAESLRKTAQELEISITEEVDLARLRSADIINKSKEKIKANQAKGLAEAAEITKKLLIDSDKIIIKMEKDAAKQVNKITAELVPNIVTKLSPQT